MVDTLGRAFFPDLLRMVLSPAAVCTAAPALSSMLIYLLMAIVLVAQAGRPVLGGQQMSGWLSARTVTVVVLLAALAFLPVYVELGGSRFLLTLFTRIIILAMAAVSLNLILGFGGMMSFGDAVYLGIGGYAVGMLAHEGIYSGFVQWPVALAASALFALELLAHSACVRAGSTSS